MSRAANSRGPGVFPMASRRGVAFCDVPAIAGCGKTTGVPENVCVCLPLFENVRKSELQFLELASRAFESEGLPVGSMYVCCS
jgi:hypothetical protein